MKIKKSLSEQLKDERQTKFKYQQLDIKQNSQKIENSKDKYDSLYHVAYQYRLGYKGNIVDDSQNILKIVSLKYGIFIHDLLSHKRNAPIMHSRHVAMFIMYHFLPMSLNKIGLVFSKRDHSTIRHAVFKIADLIGIYPHIKNEIISILIKLKYIEG